MARKRKPPTTTDEKTLEQEKAPVVTPEIEDGYDGIVKRLVCSTCHQTFYVTDADHKVLNPQACHDCSTKIFQDYQQKLKEQEILKADLEEAEKWKKILEERERSMYTADEWWVKTHVEEKMDKKSWNYGYKMLYCEECPCEKGRYWRVRIYKSDERSRTSTRIHLLLWKWDEHVIMYLPLWKDNYPYDPQAWKKSLDERFPELLETDPDFFKEDG
ncbi:hypothetical protein KDAU_20380 [Dictyobacter aurantiacus]|uniref:Uncharacterized protein n=2 Tax=Dictyobacter aurantiacus TaxID=1936993 RepID=A0A401ZCY4_9CHLR|nr:hypothetical protein KDAU_20380 [Dictyobacter aurantiacus]